MIKEFAVAIEDYKNNRNHFQTLVVFTFSGILALSASHLTSIDVKEVSDMDQILGEALITVRGQEPVEDNKQVGMQPLVGLAVDKTKRQQELMYSIGGHFPLPILTCDGQSEYLEGKGMAVGLFPEPSFDVYKKHLPDGFRITVFSDGILEVIKGPALKDKEKLLLDVVSQEQRGIESLFSSLGLDGIDDLPDDIAVLTISDTAKSAEKVNQ